MKNILIAFIFSILPLAVWSQANEVYNIVKVDGEIINKTSGKVLVPGDKIKPSDQLEFKNSYATAIVISNSRGKFTLRPPEGGDVFSDNGLLAMANTAMSPIDSRAQLSTRAVGVTEVKDLSKYLGKENFYIIGDKLSIKLSKTAYPLGPNMNIVFSYTGKTQKVSKKIGYTGQQLNLAKDQLISSADDLEKGNKLKEVGVYTLNTGTNASSLITIINLIFLNQDELTREFSVIIPLLKDQNMQRFEAVEYLKGYFNDVYGQTDPDILYLTINKEVGKYYQ